MAIDVIYLILLGLFMIRGYNKGVVVALFSFIAIILGVMGALKLSGSVSRLLFSDSQWAPFLTYIIVFVLIVWLVRLGARMIEKTFEAVALGFVNKLSGALLYGLLVTFVFSSLLWLLNQMGLIKPETQAQSKVYALIEPFAPHLFSLIGRLFPFAQTVFQDLEHFFDRINDKLPGHVDTP